MCGVPYADCCGSTSMMPKSISQGGKKVHNTTQEAYRCMRRYLIKQGYEEIGRGEFRKPGEPVKLLSKQSKFGTPLRKGKSPQDGKGGNRYTLKYTNSGYIGEN